MIDPSMESELQLLQVTRFLVGGVGFGLAAYLDVRTRRVTNRLWVLMALLAMLLWVGEMYERDRPWEHFALLGPLAVFFAFAFVDPSEWPWGARRIGWHGLQVAALVGLVWLSYRRLVAPEAWDGDFLVLLAVPALMGLMVAAYYAGVMVGGADVKALMVVGLLAPTYPDLSLLPGGLWVASDLLTVPMPLVIFGNSLLCYLAIPLLFLLFNLSQRHTDAPLPALLFGYRLPIAEARRRFVWPMQRFAAAPPLEAEAEDETDPEGVTTAKEETDPEEVPDRGSEVARATGTGTGADTAWEAKAARATSSTLEAEAGPQEAEAKAARPAETGRGTVAGPADEPASTATGKRMKEDPGTAHTPGKLVLELFPRNRGDTQEVLDDLQAQGREFVWVTPKTPYMVPLAAAWVVSHLFGDLFFNLVIW